MPQINKKQQIESEKMVQRNKGTGKINVQNRQRIQWESHNLQILLLNCSLGD